MSLAGLRDISRDRDSARGPPSRPNPRRALRRGPGDAGDPAREGARRAGVLPAQPDRHICTRPPSACERSAPEVRFADRPRPDGRASARGDDAGLRARRARRPGRDHDHRVRPRHPDREHAPRRASRPARPRAGVPDPRAASAAAGSAPSPTCSIRLPSHSPRTRRPVSPRSRTTPSWARASASPCATSRSAARATCLATSSPGHIAAVGFELYCQMLEDAAEALRTGAHRAPRGA